MAVKPEVPRKPSPRSDPQPATTLGVVVNPEARRRGRRPGRREGIEKRGSRYRARVTWRDENDRYREANRTFETEAEPRIWRATELAKLGRGVRPAATTLKLGEHVETWLASLECHVARTRCGTTAARSSGCAVHG